MKKENSEQLEAVREISAILVAYDRKTRQKIMKHVETFLLNPKDRAEKCIEYGKNHEMAIHILRAALEKLKAVTNNSIAGHPSDKDYAIKIMKTLPDYLIPLYSEDVKDILVNEFQWLEPHVELALKIAKKIEKGVRPKQVSYIPINGENLDNWIEKAEKRYGV